MLLRLWRIRSSQNSRIFHPQLCKLQAVSSEANTRSQRRDAINIGERRCHRCHSLTAVHSFFSSSALLLGILWWQPSFCGACLQPGPRSSNQRHGLSCGVLIVSVAVCSVVMILLRTQPLQQHSSCARAAGRPRFPSSIQTSRKH